MFNMRNRRKLFKQLVLAVILIWFTFHLFSGIQAILSGTWEETGSSDDFLDNGGMDIFLRAGAKNLPVMDNDNEGFNVQSKYRSSKSSRQKILLMSTERAGSSFIGEIVSKLPESYYTSDPLYFLQFGISNHTFIQDFLLGENASYYLENILRCNFRVITDASQRYFPKENETREELLKKVYPATDSIEGAMLKCLNNSKVIARTTNVRYTKHMIPLLGDPATTAIYVVRDPRGIMNSIIKTDSVNHHGEMLYNDPVHLREKIKSICDPILENLRNLKGLYSGKDSHQRKGRLFVLRFEDVAYQPHAMTQKLFKYFDVLPTEALFDWLVNITTSSAYIRNPYSTVRNSASVPEAWRDSLTFEQVAIIQEECSDVLWELGYWPIKNNEALKNRRKSVVDLIPRVIPQL